MYLPALLDPRFDVVLEVEFFIQPHSKVPDYRFKTDFLALKGLGWLVRVLWEKMMATVFLGQRVRP